LCIETEGGAATANPLIHIPEDRLKKALERRSMMVPVPLDGKRPRRTLTLLPTFGVSFSCIGMRDVPEFWTCSRPIASKLPMQTTGGIIGIVTL
jgi:hypothetical protein